MSSEPSGRPFLSLAPLLGEIRFALRTLARSPGYAAAVILTLALAIGANSAIFSLVDGVLLRPLPYEHGERLVVLDALVQREQTPRVDFSVQEVYDLRARTHTLDAVVEHHGMSFFLHGRAEPERVSTGVVSANFFDVLGVEPLAGRLFEPSDEHEGAEAVLVLGWEFWTPRSSPAAWRKTPAPPFSSSSPPPPWLTSSASRRSWRACPGCSPWPSATTCLSDSGPQAWGACGSRGTTRPTPLRRRGWT